MAFYTSGCFSHHREQTSRCRFWGHDRDGLSRNAGDLLRDMFISLGSVPDSRWPTARLGPLASNQTAYWRTLQQGQDPRTHAGGGSTDEAYRVISPDSEVLPLLNKPHSAGSKELGGRPPASPQPASKQYDCAILGLEQPSSAGQIVVFGEALKRGASPIRLDSREQPSESQSPASGDPLLQLEQDVGTSSDRDGSPAASGAGGNPSAGGQQVTSNGEDSRDVHQRDTRVNLGGNSNSEKRRAFGANCLKHWKNLLLLMLCLLCLALCVALCYSLVVGQGGNASGVPYHQATSTRADIEVQNSISTNCIILRIAQIFVTVSLLHCICTMIVRVPRMYSTCTSMQLSPYSYIYLKLTLTRMFYILVLVHVFRGACIQY